MNAELAAQDRFAEFDVGPADFTAARGVAQAILLHLFRAGGVVHDVDLKAPVIVASIGTRQVRCWSGDLKQVMFGQPRWLVCTQPLAKVERMSMPQSVSSASTLIGISTGLLANSSDSRCAK
ncbi:MAG TPA: hypothetical protein VE170_17345 [Candidatus Limnocylindria bacterium]|nr:hypothetical protein [Candidatus Limnocylindria bacterium]